MKIFPLFLALVIKATTTRVDGIDLLQCFQVTDNSFSGWISGWIVVITGVCVRARVGEKEREREREREWVCLWVGVPLPQQLSYKHTHTHTHTHTQRERERERDAQTDTQINTLMCTTTSTQRDKYTIMLAYYKLYHRPTKILMNLLTLSSKTWYKLEHIKTCTQALVPAIRAC